MIFTILKFKLSLTNKFKINFKQNFTQKGDFSSEQLGIFYLYNFINI